MGCIVCGDDLAIFTGGVKLIGGKRPTLSGEAGETGRVNE
jgi:ribosomal protein S27E